jgi:hypothetical protein
MGSDVTDISTPAKALARGEFVELANRILGDEDKYEDSVVLIQKNYSGLDLQVTRKPMPDIAEHLRVRNPTTMVMNGEIIRHHGEHEYLVPHMESLLERKMKGPSS